MITAISRFRLRDGLTPAQIMEDIKESIPAYKGRAGLVRKYICVNHEERWGCGIYLWETRAQAERFFEFARQKIREQTGADPEITLIDTPVIVDNALGTVEIAGG